MLFEILILILAVPVGFLIAWWTRDELLGLRAWFKWLIIFSVVIGIGSELYGYPVVAWTFGFVAIFLGLCYWKSFDEGWTGKR